eukprot:6483951-Amphidinium_carterae.2
METAENRGRLNEGGTLLKASPLLRARVFFRNFCVMDLLARSETRCKMRIFFVAKGTLQWHRSANPADAASRSCHSGVGLGVRQAAGGSRDWMYQSGTGAPYWWCSYEVAFTRGRYALKVAYAQRVKVP